LKLLHTLSLRICWQTWSFLLARPRSAAASPLAARLLADHADHRGHRDYCLERFDESNHPALFVLLLCCCSTAAPIAVQLLLLLCCCFLVLFLRVCSPPHRNSPSSVVDGRPASIFAEYNTEPNTEPTEPEKASAPRC
jgi:hypothetical protein